MGFLDEAKTYLRRILHDLGPQLDAGVPIVVLEDARKNYGETRYRAWGTIDGKPHMLAFSVSELRTGGKRVRAISLRPANEKEIANHGLQKKKRPGSGQSGMDR